MSSLRFYTDTHIAKAVAVELRKRGVDVIRCEEAGLAAATDEAHLILATQESRALVSHDEDFVVLDAQWRNTNRYHAGIFYIQPKFQGNIGYIVTRLYEYVELIEHGAGTLEDDIVNRVTFLG